MPVDPRAGRPAEARDLIDPAALERAYHDGEVDPDDAEQRVAFGTSGHRGSPLRGSFNAAHVLAITQAVCEHRAAAGLDGPLYVGRDTHAASAPALANVLEVLAGNGVTARVDAAGGYTPTPVVSHAILGWNRGRTRALADGIVITPSHNPPEDGGIKYDPPHGGPADADATRAIETRANELLADGLRGVRRASIDPARPPAGIEPWDYVRGYVEDLDAVLDTAVMRGCGLRIGVDPLGGAAVAYWQPIAEHLGLDLEIVNPGVDPAFAFMPLDWDGRIRMDCSSRHAMASLIAMRERFDLAFGNDPDVDRHGIVTPGAGLLDPNHYLAAASSYLFGHRPDWPHTVALGKTVVSSAILDRVAEHAGRPLMEVPVGFKWFVDGLAHGTLGFAGEESAGASFLRRDGSVWTTDKDGILLDLLAVEMTARTGMTPDAVYARLATLLGAPAYARIDAPATRAQKAALARLTPADLPAAAIGGDAVRTMITHAPGNDAAIGGIKVITDHGWFAARPSGTEAVYKLYAESFRGAEHLARIQHDARALLAGVLEPAR